LGIEIDTEHICFFSGDWEQTHVGKTQNLTQRTKQS